jgi:thiol-disulfide isomerase/thioredoxin
MRNLLVLMIFTLPLISNAQFRQYNVVDELKQYEGRPEIIYLTALWCHPCMVKLMPVLDSFKSNNEVRLTILFDYYGMSASMYQKLAAKFDTSFFRVMPTKYYASEKRSIIQVNPSNRVFKAFYKDLNAVHGTSFDMKTLWVGMAIIRTSRGIEVAKGDTAEELLADIKLKIAGD